ncbi:hypothetical protein RHECNPAF_1700027 [Rhizobium etli CNPAF512]|nr:hypothetical protein RHECNPAF_1700027 [Rhizobium etli CNPAF512]
MSRFGRRSAIGGRSVAAWRLNASSAETSQLTCKQSESHFNQNLSVN